jgi:hypothetical protein
MSAAGSGARMSAYLVYEYREKTAVAAFPTQSQADEYVALLRKRTRGVDYEVQKGDAREVEE